MQSQVRLQQFLIIISLLLCFCISCVSHKRIYTHKKSGSSPGGNEFFKSVSRLGWKQRDSLAEQQILNGNIPRFLSRFTPIRTNITDSATGRRIRAIYYVSTDYLAIGSDDDWARMPLTPNTAQRIADKWNCFLPTRKMVNDIYNQARVRLEPMPMFAFRDSSVTMWQHHLIVEGQRQGRQGLIAGIKKDVVISGKISRDPRPDRVAIYGWHQLSGIPIQPLYTGHVNWYVDYSHGIRLVHRTIIVNGKAMDYTAVLEDLKLRRLLCDEEYCDFYKYPR